MKSIFLILTKITLIGTLIIVLSILGFFAYSELNKRGAFMIKEEKYFYEKLREFKYSGKETVFLKELTNFEWKSLKIYTPYSPAEDDTYLEFYRVDGSIIRIKGYQVIFGTKIFRDNSFAQFAEESKSLSKKKSSDFLIKIDRGYEINYKNQIKKVFTILVF